MSTNNTDEQVILEMMQEWSRAVERKDLDAIVKNYLPDVVLFDVKPPYKIEGVGGIRQAWESCLPYFPDTFRSEHRDLRVHVNGDQALVHGLHHFVPTPADHPCGQTWIRLTIGFLRVDGCWKVAHEHVSLPFNPMDGKTWYITDPDELSVPDYSAGCSEGEC